MHDERPSRKNSLADCIQSVRCTGKQLLQSVELEPVNGIPGLRIDETKRDHAIEEEVVGVLPGSSELPGCQALLERQFRQNPEILSAGAGIPCQPLVPNPCLARNDHR